MSKRLRKQSKSQDMEQPSPGEENTGRTHGANPAASTEAGQSPRNLMLLLWGIPLLVVIAAVLVQRLT